MHPDDESTLTSVKLDINALLWKHLPGDTTLAEAEKMACRWFDEVVAVRRAVSARPREQRVWAWEDVVKQFSVEHRA